jgi:hypothetical protein
VLPRDFGLAELRRHLEMFQRNFRALLGYVPGRYAGRLVLLNAENGEDGEDDEGTKEIESWKALAEEADLHLVPGDHYTMVHRPHVEILGELLGAYLAGREALART